MSNIRKHTSKQRMKIYLALSPNARKKEHRDVQFFTNKKCWMAYIKFLRKSGCDVVMKHGYLTDIITYAMDGVVCETMRSSPMIGRAKLPKGQGLVRILPPRSYDMGSSYRDLHQLTGLGHC